MYLLLIFSTLIGSFLSGLFGRHFGIFGSSIITVSCLCISFLISILTFYEVSFKGSFVYVKLFS